jgi:L-arabinose isomerase
MLDVATDLATVCGVFGVHIVVLRGHDGPGHPGIAEAKTKGRPLGAYHGKVGKGLSVERSCAGGGGR